MSEPLFDVRYLKRNVRKSEQTKHIMFLVPSISDEHTVYFLKDHVLKYINDETYYCSFISLKINFSLIELSNQVDCVINLRKTTADSSGFKKLAKMLKYEGVDEYIKHLPELYFATDVDEFHILGGSETIFPKRSYSKHEPYKSLENSFHDHIEDGHEDAVNDMYSDNPLIHFPITTFMYWSSGAIFASVVIARKKGILKNVTLFCVDPTASIKFLKMYDIPIVEYYIAEDKRGTRDFTKYDFGKYMKKEIIEKTSMNFFDTEEDIDFVFGGRLFAPEREKDVSRFFHDLSGITKKIFTPSSMSLKDKETNNEYENFYPPIPYWNFMKELKNARYTFIMRPWTKNDSLNIRLYEALTLDVLPFVADNYDPESYQIDRKLFEKYGLIVSSSKEMTNFINKTSEEDRIKILNEIKNIYGF
jgi:hypothetical protein